MKRFNRILSMLLILTLSAALMAITAVSASAEGTQHTITFDVQGIGETPDPITINDGEKFLYLRENGANNPTADGYVFHCWVTSLDYEPDEVTMSNTAAYLETPVTEDMTLYALWYKIVDHVEVKVDPPVPGDVIGTERYETPDYSFDYQSPRPHVTVLSEGARLYQSGWFNDDNVFWLKDPDDHESNFKGTFQSGTVYGAWIDLEPVFGYEFADSLTITVNGVTRSQQMSDYNRCIFTAPILCGKQSAAVKATPDEAAKDNASENPHAVPTGYGYGIVWLAILLLAGVIVLGFVRRRA